jgi:hypothetical protein
MSKIIPCKYEKCGGRRVHWQDPETPRGRVMLKVDDDVEFQYCSVNCACYDGAFSVTKGWLNKENNVKENSNQ